LSVQSAVNQHGNYNITHLQPGRYELQAAAPGFKSKIVQEIQIFADQAARIDFWLDIGVATESVTVQGDELPLLKTNRADTATTFTAREAAELPLFDRNFTALQLATPGMQQSQWQHASSENPQGSLQIMANGQHFSGTSFVLDGTDNRDPLLGIVVINPTLDSVAETKIMTSSYDAEFGEQPAP